MGCVNVKENNMPKEITKYRGKVNIAYRKGKNIVKKSTHNNGLPDMAMLFAKAITGTMNYDTDIPRLLDIGYVVPNTESVANEGDSGVWMSILNNPVAIGGRQFKFDTALRNWVGILTTTVFAQDLNSPLLPEVIENMNNGIYVLKLRLCSYTKKNRKYFAEVTVDEDFLTGLRDSTSAIITWYAELLYDEENSFNIIRGIVTTVPNELPETEE